MGWWYVPMYIYISYLHTCTAPTHARVMIAWRIYIAHYFMEDLMDQERGEPIEPVEPSPSSPSSLTSDIDWDARLLDRMERAAFMRAVRLAVRTEMHLRRQAGLAKRHARKLARKPKEDTDS